jgi:hypothetical protein
MVSSFDGAAMLHSLDILIGVTTVMMVLSLAVTMLTQFVLDLLKLRWLHLREGILEILTKAGAEGEELRQVLQSTPLRGRVSLTLDELTRFGGRAVDSSDFEATMARVAQQFTARSRCVVLVIAATVAVALPLDTLDLFQALSEGDGVVFFPATLTDWSARWSHVNAVGVALSAILLSLGAPAWFEVLKDLLRLKGER